MEEECLRRAGVGVEVARLRVAGGPAGGLGILEIDEAVRHDAADRVAHVTGAAEVVAFAADESVVTGRIGAALHAALEDVAQAATRGRQEFLIRRDTGDLEEGRGEVDEAHEVGDLAARVLDALGPADGEGQVIGVLVGRALHAGEGHAVVARHDHDGVLQLAGLLEELQGAADVAVEVFDLIGVIQHVVADRFVVGPEGGDAVDVAGLLAAEAGAGAGFVVAVRLDGAEPEEPRLAGLGLLQEGLEVGAVIVVRDAGRRGLGLLLVELLAGHRAGRAVGLERQSGRPDFARGGVSVAVLLEQVGEDDMLGGEDALVVGGGAEEPRVASGEDGRTRGRALRRRCVGVEEEQTLLGDAIEVRRLDPRATVGAGMAAAPVIGRDEEHVRTRRFGGGEAGEGDAEQGEEQGGAHGSGVSRF